MYHGVTCPVSPIERRSDRQRRCGIKKSKCFTSLGGTLEPKVSTWDPALCCAPTTRSVRCQQQLVTRPDDRERLVNLQPKQRPRVPNCTTPAHQDASAHVVGQVVYSSLPDHDDATVLIYLSTNEIGSSLANCAVLLVIISHGEQWIRLVARTTFCRATYHPPRSRIDQWTMTADW